MNYAFIAADPYLQYYNRNLDQDVSNEDISQASLEQAVEVVRVALPQQEAYIPALGNDFDSIMQTHIEGGASRIIQKRFIRLYQHFSSAQEAGKFGLLLAQNIARCRDGISDYFTQLEKQYIYQIEEDIPLEARFGRVLLDYKDRFLDDFRNPLIGSHEEATEGQVLLRERMRLPLGFPGNFLNPLYPSMGRGMAEMYKPEKVIEVFLDGGYISFERGEQSTSSYMWPYSPSKMVYCLQDEINLSSQDLRCLGRERFITYEQLSHYIPQDPFLEAEFERAFDEMEENDYFNTDASQAEEQLYKPRFYEYLLRKFGYLLGGE